MCGRFTLVTPAGRLAEAFGLSDVPPEIPPSYNVAPGGEIAAILADGDARRLEMLRWGLVPSWADDPGIGARMINARSETAPEKPSFRRAFRGRRCLIPADGFYEWKREGGDRGGKQPYHFRLPDGRPFAFAGLWESWEKGDEPLRSCAILTTEADESMRAIHHRMPVVVPVASYGAWLDPGADEEELKALLAPGSAANEALEAYPVSRSVNSPANDGPGCIEPAA